MSTINFAQISERFCGKCIKKILFQDFESVADHFEALLIKGLIFPFLTTVF